MCAAQKPSQMMAATVRPGGVQRGLSPPLTWRRLLARRGSTIAHLHDVLKFAFGSENMHLNRFNVRGRECGVYRDGGPLFDTDAGEGCLCDMAMRRLERLPYEYGFGGGWVHEIRLDAAR